MHHITLSSRLILALYRIHQCRICQLPVYFSVLLLHFLPALWTKVKVGVLRPVQQPGSYWDRSSELPLVGLEPTEVTAYD